MELIVREKLNPATVFTPEGMDPLLEKIIIEVRSHVPDLSTAKGRKEVASLSAKVSRSKTLLDGLGKELVSDWKEKAKLVDDVRRDMRDRLDKLKIEARKPLTDWEAAEETRVRILKERVKGLHDLAYMAAGRSPSELRRFIIQLKGTEIGPDWDEFEEPALVVKENSLAELESCLKSRQRYDAEQAELEQLRKEKVERDKKDHDERIAQAAANKAKREAEEKAQAEADKVRLEAEAKERAIEAEKKREIEAREKAERDAKASEERRIAAEKAAAAHKVEAEKRRIAADKQRVLDIANARKEEERRIEAKRKAEKAAEDAAREKREASVRNRKKVEKEAAQALMGSGLGELEAMAVVQSIAKGDIPHVRIEY